MAKLDELHDAYEQAVENHLKAQQAEWNAEFALLDEVARQVNAGELKAEYCSTPLDGRRMEVQEWDCDVSPIRKCLGSGGCIFCGGPRERK